MELECEAILFDLDGVLVDSTRAVERVWRDWAGERELDADEILQIAHGRRTAETIALVAPHLDAEAEALKLEQLEIGNMEGVREAEGARALLSKLPEGSWTVVTSGARPLATGRMDHLRLPLPGAFVTAEDVSYGKPAPEAYLRGAGIVGVRPGDCVVMEDAPAGIQAATAAGMTAVAVATTHEPGELSGARAVANSLADIRISPVAGEDPVQKGYAARLILQVNNPVESA